MKNLIVMKRNHFATDIGMRYGFALIVALFLAPFWALGQTDYSGVYYIGSAGYNASSPANNYYLCPTEGWLYYMSTNNWSPDGTAYPNPFLTTFKCKTNDYHSGNSRDAVWIIEKAHNSEYYYIKQASTGRYMVSNGQISGTSNANRMRVHIESVTPENLDDKALFSITPYSDYLVISPKSSAGWNGTYKWYTVNSGNKDALGGSGSNGGPSGHTETGGILGTYTQNDANAHFYLEPATVAAPTITNNYDGTITITAASGATIYYTTDGTTPTVETTTTGTTPVTVTLTEEMQVIKAIAKSDSDYFPSLVSTYEIPVCERPVITVSNTGMVSITCATPDASIYYTLDDTPATPSSSSSTQYNAPFPQGTATVIRAVAQRLGYLLSVEAEYRPAAWVHHSSEITNMGGRYNLADDFVSEASIGTESDPFTGTIDGQLNAISGLDHPLVAYANGATIKNVILDNVNINNGENVGAICGEALGACRIYNCGVLATGSTVETDEDGYTMITDCSSTISGSNYVGGLVGLLDGSSRVINCFSYANITGGSSVGGIVGYNNVATTANNLQTMVMNCMFYGDITGGTSKAPIYNGTIITNNGGDNGVSNFNYFHSEVSYVQDQLINVYNCALAAETRFLQRFEFFRHLLNSNRALAAWWATGSRDNKDEMLKWVMEPDQIGTTTPYPILKTPGKYPSVVNYTPSDVAIDDENQHRNEGRKLTNMGSDGKLSVKIQMGTQGSAPYGAPEGAALLSEQASTTINLTINDKDPAHFNFNYGKVQLPYYNDVGTKNYNDNRVVTGWKIVEINGSTTGTGRYDAGDDVSYDAGGNLITPYNFADRNCTNKDLYSVSGRVFNQGAYWDVPYGVTAITIEPYWAKAAYVADAYADVVYNTDMTTAYNVDNVGGGSIYTNGYNYTIAGDGQTVYTSVANAVNALNPGANHTVYDNAVVLVGNYHLYAGTTGINNSKPYTVTSVDLDGDNEPDYSVIMRFDGRTKFHALKYDFVHLVGLGMAQKSTGGKSTYNFGIPQPAGWFEVTNTALFRVTQFEYERSDRSAQPIVLHGGVIEQWVSAQNSGISNKTTYFHVGSNVWFKEFHLGCHQDRNDIATKHPPVSVTGGDFDAFYLTGLYATTVNYEDDAECYVNGGRFGTVAGTGMEGIGNASTHNKGNITWLIDNADIKEFFAGGTNAAKPAEGNLNTMISNSHVDFFCGGPKFGDMNTDRTVKTTATNCTFGIYFGAGYGGNSYYSAAPGNFTNTGDPWLPGEQNYNLDWDKWVKGEIKATLNHGNYSNGVVYNGYWNDYISQFGGVSVGIDYQFLPFSNNTYNVGRLFLKFVNFSLATTCSVTSTLTGCTIINSFYGGGSLGKVDGNVVSVLDGCNVQGNVFGAGYSATLVTVPVMSTGGFERQPYYNKDLGFYLRGKFLGSVDYTWEHRETVESTSTAIDTDNHILYTTVDIGSTNLGSVSGNITLTLKGNTIVGNGTADTGNVFGGGDQSAVTGNTLVEILGHTKVLGNIYGGGNMGVVGGNTKVVVNGQSNNNGQGTGSGNNPNND